MKNKLIDLNNHMFTQLERLSDEDVTGDVLKEEINRSRAITRIASQVIDNGRLMLDAQKALNNGHINDTNIIFGVKLLED